MTVFKKSFRLYPISNIISYCSDARSEKGLIIRLTTIFGYGFNAYEDPLHVPILIGHISVVLFNCTKLINIADKLLTYLKQIASQLFIMDMYLEAYKV